MRDTYKSPTQRPDIFWHAGQKSHSHIKGHLNRFVQGMVSRAFFFFCFDSDFSVLIKKNNCCKKPLLVIVSFIKGWWSKAYTSNNVRSFRNERNSQNMPERNSGPPTRFKALADGGRATDLAGGSLYHSHNWHALEISILTKTFSSINCLTLINAGEIHWWVEEERRPTHRWHPIHILSAAVVICYLGQVHCMMLHRLFDMTLWYSLKTSFWTIAFNPRSWHVFQWHVLSGSGLSECVLGQFLEIILKLACWCVWVFFPPSMSILIFFSHSKHFRYVSVGLMQSFRS